MHVGLMEGFNGGARRAAGGAVLFDLTAVMSRQITKAHASRETDQARLPRLQPFKKYILLYSSSIDGLRHGAKLEIKKRWYI